MKKKANDYYLKALQNNVAGLYPEAVADYTRAIEIDSSHIDAYLKRGIVRYKILKQYELSLTDFDVAIKIDPRCVAAYLHRGIVKCHLLKFDDAIPDFDRTIELDPNEERAYFNRGKGRYMLKYDEKDIRADLEKAILLHASYAADMLELFYGSGQHIAREHFKSNVKEKSEEK